MKIAIIGCGNLGQALTQILLQHNLKLEIKSTVSKTKSENNSVISWADIILLTFKPKELTEFIMTSKASLKPNQLIVSCLAGVKLEQLAFDPNQPLVRCMTNIPVRVGAGSVVFKANSHVTSTQKKFLTDSFVGPAIHWLEDEAHFDAITVLIGSGPAFFSKIYQSFYQSALTLGLPPILTDALLRETIIGTTKLIESDFSFGFIQQQVTSKGGITETGLNTFSDLNIDHHIQSVVQSTYNHCLHLGR